MRNTDTPNLGLDPLDAAQASLSAENTVGSQHTKEKENDEPTSTTSSSTLIRNVSIGVLSVLMLSMVGWHFYTPLQQHLAAPKMLTRTTLHPKSSASAPMQTPDSLLAADHARVEVLEQSVSDLTQQTAAQFKPLQTSIASIQHAQQQVITQLNTLQSASAQNNTADLNTTMATLQVELAQLKSEVDALKTEKNASSTLPATTLPFQALSVNSLSGVPYVLINTAHENALVRQGDMVQGWTLTSLDYSSQTVVFEDGQHHVARLVL